MINSLRRLFIKHHAQTSDPAVREAHGVFCAIFGIITNLILVAMKLGAAIIMASMNSWIFSMAIIGDAVNNAGDMSSCIVTLIGFKASNKPADKGHPFGHQRIEYVAGLVVAIAVIFAGLELGYQSFEKIIKGAHGVYDWPAVIILGISILIKLFQAYVNYSFGKAISSPTLKSTAIDSLSDSVATLFIGITAVLSILFHWGFLDGYVGIAVSLFILYSGVIMVKETANPLIGEAQSQELGSKIEALIKSNPKVLGVHDTLIHNYGPTNSFVSLHAEVNQKLSLNEAHEIADSLEREAKAKFGCILTIHIDPIAVGDAKIEQINEKISAVLSAINAQISMHDLHIFKENEQEIVSLDILVPYSVEGITQDLLEKTVQNVFDQMDYHPLLRIALDRPYQE